MDNRLSELNTLTKPQISKSMTLTSRSLYVCVLGGGGGGGGGGYSAVKLRTVHIPKESIHEKEIYSIVKL